MRTSEGLSVLDRVVRAIAYWQRRHFTTGVIVHVTDASGRVLLVRQRWRQRGRWGLPGGFIRPGEDYADAAIREVREETSVEISSPCLVDVYVQSHARHVDVLMTARSVDPEASSVAAPATQDRFEIAGARWWPALPEALPELTVETREAFERLSGSGEGLAAD